jgi:hypothetical protein
MLACHRVSPIKRLVGFLESFAKYLALMAGRLKIISRIPVDTYLTVVP